LLLTLRKVRFTTESSYYYSFPENICDRIDFNYNSPEYDKIELFLSKSKYNIIELNNKRYILQITSGTTPNGIQYLEEDEEGVPFLGSTQILCGHIDIDSAPRIDKTIHETTLSNSKIKQGNVLVTMAGTIGRVATYNLDRECNANQAVAILTLNEQEVNPNFLVQYLNSDIGQLFFGKLQHVSSQPNINLKEIQKIKVILPNKKQQEEFMIHVQKVLNDATNATAQVESKLAEIEEIFLTELNLHAPQKTKYDYYSELIENVPDRLDFVFNYPFYQSLDEAKKEANCGFTKLAPPFVAYSTETTNPLERPEQQFEYVDIGNVNIKWGTLKSETMLGKDATSSRVRRVIHKGEILLSTTRPTRKAIAVVPDSLNNQVCSTGFAVIRTSNELDSEYLFYILRSNFMKFQFERYSSGSSYPELNKNDLPLIEVPYPEEEKKRKTVTQKIRLILEKAKELEQVVQIKTEEANKLFNEMLFKA